MHVIPVRFGLFLEVKLPCSVVCNVDVFGLFHFCSSTMHRRKTGIFSYSVQLSWICTTEDV
jgi:hypothetical protein